MKRFLNMLLAFIMVFALCGGGTVVNAEESEGAAGVWKLVEMRDDGGLMTREDLQAYEEQGVVMYLKLRDNGTAKFSLFGEVMEGSWSEYGIILDYTWLTYIVDGDKLIVDNLDGGEMIFERSSMEEIYAILGYQDDVLDEDVDYSNEEKQILDTDNASVVITGYRADMTGFTVFLCCTNKTRNGIMIRAEKCVLNKYIFDPEWSVSLESRESLDTEMTISPLNLEKCNISAVDEMILELQVANSGSERILDRGILAKVYPTGKAAKDVKAPARTPVENEYRIYNNSACAYIIQGNDPDHFGGYAVNCYLENRSARTLTFTWTDVTINGKSVTLDYEEEVLSGTLGYSDVVFMHSDLDEIGIVTGDITSIKGKVKVYDKAKSTPELIAEKEFNYTLQ